MAMERLEDRSMLSTISWVNRGDGTDNFDTVFGANDDLARAVVDAALDDWEQLITNFQQAVLVPIPVFPFFDIVNPNTIEITLSMDPTDTGFGGGAGAPADYDLNGHPLARSISIDSGNDTTGDGMGDGAGWYLDPNPNDHAEFAGTIMNAFVGQATAGGPAVGLSDLYSIVTIEMNHALGLTNFQDSGSPRWRDVNPFITDSGVADTIDNPGNLFTFVSGNVSALLTANNGGPGGTDTGLPLHVARPQTGTPVPGFSGALDVGNASYSGGQRYLPSLLSSLMLQDVYGYTLAAGGADVFGTMHALWNSTNGNVLVRGMTGTNNSADIINISRSGSELVISVDVGADVPGTGPTGPLESRFNIATVNSITINGLDGADTIQISGDLSFLTGPITITGDGGADSLTVNFASGNPVPASGVNYDGGTGAGDSLILEGGSFASEVYTATGSSSGSISFGSSVITFSNIAPITDTVTVTDFTFNATGSGELINIVDGPTVTTVDCPAGCQSTEINSGSGSFELIDFAHKTNVTANGAGGGDTITLNNPNPAEGLSSLTIAGGTGGDTINVRRTIAALPVTVNGGDQDDTINIGSVGNSLDTIQGAVTVNGDGSGGDALNFNDQGDADPHTYTINATTLSRSGAAVVTYGSVEVVTVNGGSGGNTVNVRSTAAGTSVIVNSGTGTDTINVGNLADSLDDLQGALSVNGQIPGAGDALNINDQGDANSQTYVITSTSASRSGAASITYSNVESLTLNAGLDDNTINVRSTLATTPVTVNGGPSDDTINVGNLAGSLDEIQGALFVNGNDPAASDALNVNDQGDTDVHVYIITATTVQRDGAADITYATVETLTVNGGSGGNAINVRSTAATTAVVVNAGAGDDSVTVDSNGGPEDPPDGTVDLIVSSVTVNGQGGVNTLRLEDFSDPNLVTGDTVHVTPSQIGADPTDNFFGTGGSLTYSDLVHVTLNLSNGYFPDTVHLIPSATTAFELHGNDPDCPMNPDQLPGDALFVDFTGVTDPKLISDGEGNSVWTFGNREDVAFDGFEKLNHVGIIVVAPDAGSPPLVRVIGAETGAEQLSFMAFDANFHGGVRVAVGDVSCDGIPDIIVGAGPGSAPLVRVFNGATGLPLAGALGGFFAYDPGSQSGVWVAAGDINQDGFSDIITGPDNGGGPAIVKVFSGEAGQLHAQFTAYGGNFQGGVRVAVGDINGDSVPDIVTAPGAGRAPEVRVFDGSALSDTPLTSFLAYDNSYRHGLYLAVGDMNGDGRADIVVSGGSGGERLVRVFDGTNLADPPLLSFKPYSSNGGDSLRVAAVDIDEDGDFDLVTAPGPGGKGQPSVFEMELVGSDLTATALDDFFASLDPFADGNFVGAGG
jgi:hypothetical protein